MSELDRGSWLHLAAQGAAAFLASAAFFAASAAAIPVRDETVLVVIFAVVDVLIVLEAGRRLGPVYGVPLAIAAGLAIDSFYIPPTRPFGSAHWQNWLVMAIYVLLGVLIGLLAERTQRRGVASEEARGALAEEQAALRRVATLVAKATAPQEVFDTVAEELGRLLGADHGGMLRYDTDGTATIVAEWSRPGIQPTPVGSGFSLDGDSVTLRVLHTHRPARIDDYGPVPGALPAAVRAAGSRSSVGAPIIVDDRLWGTAIVLSNQLGGLPTGAEARIANFAELVATAISNTEAREEVARLADEQAALRRVATLVALGVPPSDLFSAVTEEVGRLVGADLARMACYASDDTVTSVAAWPADGEDTELVGPFPLDEGALGSAIARTGAPARVDDPAHAAGRIAAVLRDEFGVRSSVGTPILVEGRLWGALIVHSTQENPLPADSEARLLNFTELVATAISNAQARAEVQRLADAQAALRRVATLVARESSAEEVFAAVAEELGRLLHVDDAAVFRYDDDGLATAVGDWGASSAPIPTGTRVSLDGNSVTALVHRTRQPARLDGYSTNASGALAGRVSDAGVRSAVGGPIVVEGRLWGATVAATRQTEPLPPDTEARIAQFSDLVATAISNIQARSDLAASRARIVAATDEERRRVVRDLHDGAQQRLVHTVITLKLTRRALQRSEHEGASALLSEALGHAERANDELRELSHGILPSVLTSGGLRAGVDALASRMTVPVANDVAVGRLPAAVEATAYFVVAEALTNVAKHSHAGLAAVAAHVEDGTLRVDVRDDGVGGARLDGSGLQGLCDRVAVLDGRLRVESPPEGGTLVAADIPLGG